MMDLATILWLLLDNAELLRDACWFGMAACVWCMAAAIVGMIWAFTSR